MSEKKLSKDSAQEQLNILLDYYDLELDDLSDDARSVIEIASGRLLKAIQNGRIEIKEEDDTLNIYQYLKKPIKGIDPVIKYKEITGRAKIAMKDNKDTDYYGRMYSLLGGLSGHGASVIMSLKGVDISTAENLCAVFLQV